MAIKLALCVDSEGRLVGAVSDGDLRRGYAGLNMQDPVREIANPAPLVVPVGADREMVHAIMKVNKVLQVPVLDAEGRVVGLHLWDSLNTTPSHDHVMVIMVGGKARVCVPTPKIALSRCSLSQEANASTHH